MKPILCDVCERVSTDTIRPIRAHLTGKTLDHRLSLALCVVLPPAPAELGVEVSSIHVPSIRFFEMRMQGAWMRECTRGAVAAEVALGKEFELFMVRVACD